MNPMPAPIAQQFILNPPRTGGLAAAGGSSPVSYTTPAEAFETFYKAIDPELMYLNPLSRLLYNVAYVKSDEPDPRSLLPGYRLVEVGGVGDKKRKPKVNWDGYNTVMNTFMMNVGIAISTTEFDRKEFQLLKFCIDATMALDDMLIANRREWEFSDFAFHIPFGMMVCYNIYAVACRSANGGRMMKDMMKALGGALSGGSREEDRTSPKVWRSPFKAQS